MDKPIEIDGPFMHSNEEFDKCSRLIRLVDRKRLDLTEPYKQTKLKVEAAERLLSENKSGYIPDPIKNGGNLIPVRDCDPWVINDALKKGYLLANRKLETVREVLRRT